MQYEQYQPYYQGDVDESAGYVKCEKPKQPKNDQDCSNYPKHVVISLLLSARTAAIMCVQPRD
jgi:hypothetical protein